MKKNVRAGQRRKLGHMSVYAGLAMPLAALAQVAEQPVMTQVEVQAQRIEENYAVKSAKTATPLDLSLRETPQSVSVVTLQRIEDQNLQTVTDVVNNATGVSVNQYETHRAGFTSRGFDITNLQIDGIPTTWEAAWSAGEVLGNIAMYERIEIVRGATGLMTGAGSPSAAINLVRKRATSKELTGYVQAGIGRWDERRVQADVSTPLNQSGTVRARVVGEYSQADSWVKYQERKDKTLYATIEADLTPDTLLTAGFSRQETDPKGTMWGGLPFYYSNGAQTNWDRSKTTSPDWTTWGSTVNNGFAELEHRFANGWKVRASAQRSDRRGNSYLMYLWGVPSQTTGEGIAASPGSYNTRSKQTDVGVYASGPFELAGRKHEAAFGYQHSKQDFLSQNRAATWNGSFDAPAVGDFNNWNGAAYPEPAWGPLGFYEESTTKQEGLYGVARFTVTDKLKAIVGARVSNYEKTGHGLWTTAYTIKKNREVTPYAGLVYTLNDNYSVYGSYTDIFQPQNMKDFNGGALDPVVGKNYEAGVKGEFLDKRVNASFAVFRIKQDGLGQEAGTIDRDGASGPLLPETYYRAVDGATSKGFEGEISGELARGWNGTLGYTQFHAEDGAGQDFNSIYPRKLLRAYTTYRFGGALNALTVGGGVNWERRTYTADPTAPANTSGMIVNHSYALANLMARYDINDRLSAQVNVNNLFDKTYFGMFAAFNAITYGAPRSVSASLKYRF